jgi:hypothetical protein
MSSPGLDGGAAGRPSQVAGPHGRPISLDTLPPPDTRRWVTRRKAEVVAAVAGGLLTPEDACARYSLTHEELGTWQRLIAAHGVRGLRVTRLKDYRLPESAAAASSAVSETTEPIRDGGHGPSRSASTHG